MAPSFPFPDFEQFVTTLKAHFSSANDLRQFHISMETMNQGFRTIHKDAAKFETVLAKISEDNARHQ